MCEPRKELRRVLRDWQSGHCKPTEIKEWAETREDEAWTDDPIVRDITSHLAIADVNLTTSDEIPLFLEMLDLPESEAREAHERYGAEQDIKAVKRRWKNDPFYGPFCD